MGLGGAARGVPGGPPRPRARQSWIELVHLLEAAGQDDAAFEELRRAVRYEPGHKEAWLLLFERCTGRGLLKKAAWALENAATSTPDDLERARTWEKLAHFTRDLLGDEKSAAQYEARALGIHASLDEPTLAEDVPDTAAEEAAAEAAEPEPSDTQPLELEPGWIPEALLVPRLPPRVAIPAIESQLSQALVSRPLDANVHRGLASEFERHGLRDRAALLREIAEALDGRVNLLPRAPRLVLNSRDRAGLRHPGLRNEAGALLVAVGEALCDVFAEKERASRSGGRFREEAGKGAPAAATALLGCIQLLGLPAPELQIAATDGPPFALLYAAEPRIAIGRLAVDRTISAPELRFFAARALFSLNPDLLALRCLSRDGLQRALLALESLIHGDDGAPPGRERLAERIAPAELVRAATLMERARDQLSASGLSDAARHSANRAGLVACGGVGPAVAALRAKKALDRELIELVRYAASAPYFALRNRKLATAVG